VLRRLPVVLVIVVVVAAPLQPLSSRAGLVVLIVVVIAAPLPAARAVFVVFVVVAPRLPLRLLLDHLEVVLVVRGRDLRRRVLRRLGRRRGPADHLERRLGARTGGREDGAALRALHVPASPLGDLELGGALGAGDDRHGWGSSKEWAVGSRQWAEKPVQPR
jgi:hypothetical protein